MDKNGEEGRTMDVVDYVQDLYELAGITRKRSLISFLPIGTKRVKD